MSHISLFILRKTNNPDDCADLVALKTQIFLFFFCLKLVPDYCFYNNREQVQGKWAKLAERVKSGDFKGCFFFFPFSCCLCGLVGNWPIRPTFPLHLSGCQSQQCLIKKKEKEAVLRVGVVTHRWAWSSGPLLQCAASLQQHLQPL